MSTPLLRQVKASAGSGKTFDLTRRFLEHLARSRQEAYAPRCALAKAGWGDILAVTFTNSAAAEMKERVIRRLKETALGIADDGPIDSAHAARWVDIILRQYGALNIRTIDSLLHMVVRTAALELGLPPDFELAFTTDETLTPILDACMERAWQGDAHMHALLREACRSLIYHADAKGFTAGDRLLIALRPLLDAAITGQWPDLSPPEALETRLEQMRTACLTRAASVLHYLEKEGLSVDKRALTAFQKYADGDTALESTYLHKNHLDACLLKASKGTASARAVHAYAALVEAATTMKGDGHILRLGLRLLPFAALAREVGLGLAAFQQAEGKIPGALMPVLARQVLEMQYGVPAALCRLGSHLFHILMDEFQDTSRPQWDAMRPLVEEALSRGGSLTWVGDIKQAIYGWREGDASLFDGVLRDRGLLVMAPAPECHTLDTNWRSREIIVHSNNALFAALEDRDTAQTVLTALLAKECPPEVLCAAAQDVSHTFAKAAQKPRPGDATGGLVTIAAVTGTNKGDLAEAVREELRHRLLDDVATRRAWADVTILVRSNTDASLAAGWLMEWGVPVITENSLLLGDHPLIVETLAFLAFLDSPEDDLAFWTVLCGRIMAPCLTPGVVDAPTLVTLQDWAVTRRKGPMSMAFRDAFPPCWNAWWVPFHSRAHLMSPYDIVQEWYRHLRVEERFPLARTFVRRFLEVLHTAIERGHATLGTFLEHWKRSGGEEKVPMPSHADAVRIMTIHKSKGLQFPVVILPWMNFSLQNDNPALPWQVDDLCVLAPRCKEMGEIHYTAQAATAREALNLLYVAWTRPEEELHVFHTSTTSQPGRHRLDKALDVLLPKANLTPPMTLGVPTKSRPAAPTLLSPMAPPAPLLPPADRPMSWLPRLKIYRNPLQELIFTKKHRGILAHRCLEHLRLTGDTQADARQAVLQGMRAFPMRLPEPEALEAAFTQALHWYASLPHTAAWMRDGMPEQTLLDGENQQYRVDLLIPPARQGGQGQGWLAVDYKTGDTEEEHITQIRRYMSLLDALPPTPGAPTPAPAMGVLVYLDLRCCRTLTRHDTGACSPGPFEGLPDRKDERRGAS